MCVFFLSLGDENIPPQITRYNKLFGEAFLGPLVRRGCECNYIYALDSHTVVGYHSFQLIQMHKYSSKDDDEGHINASAKSCEIRLYQGMT